MKTYMANPDKIERKWYVVDAAGCTLGRLSSEVAKVLRGKKKLGKGTEEAYKIIRREVIGIVCTMENVLLFERAKLLAGDLERTEDLKWIELQLKNFYNALEEAKL